MTTSKMSLLRYSIFAVLFIFVAARKHGQRETEIEISGGSGESSTRLKSRSFPEFFRIEVELVKLDNPGSIRSDGKDCDWNSKCDPVVSAVIDIAKPLSAFPGETPAVNKWPTIFTAPTDSFSPVIGVSVNRDVCGGAVDKVAARVNVLDADTPGLTDQINQFDCVYNLLPSDIASDAFSAQWSKPFDCVPYFQLGKMTMTARQRAYQISADNCAALNKTPDHHNPKPAANPSIHTHSPGKHDYVRLDVELVQLLNPKGITHKKVACDSTSKCDPSVSVHLDLDKPLSDFPGSRQVPEFNNIFSASDVDSPVINRNVTKDICGGALNYANLRARVEDSDTPVSTADLIDDFNCLFQVDYKTVGSDLLMADWAPTQDCLPLHAGHDIRLQYRYRLYDISPAECNVKN